ncbi:MAG TPA: hypothetical protein VNG11_06045 [Chloroflexota bacterium]|nr:hypothetical protein [Chloroflexota bacterium]
MLEPPGGVKQGIAGQDDTGVADEIREQSKFLIRQSDVLPVTDEPLVHQIEPKLGGERRAPFRLVERVQWAAAEQRVDLGQQLGQVRRFANVSIGPGLQYLGSPGRREAAAER